MPGFGLVARIAFLSIVRFGLAQVPNDTGLSHRDKSVSVSVMSGCELPQCNTE